jgi:2-octaprenylphenol hydroxylase
MQKAYYDCVIVGGGVVGSATANRLLMLGLNVALVDTNVVDGPGQSDSALVSALNHNSEQLLKTLNAWPNNKVCGWATPYQVMTVYDNAGGGRITFDCRQLNSDNLGHIVNNQTVKYNLRQFFYQNGGHLLAPDKVLALNSEANDWSLTLEQHGMLHTPLIVAADGARSWVRRQVNIDCSSHDYDQTAFVATLNTEKSHDFTARQWFHPSGVLAFLPLANAYQVAIVWSLNDNSARQLEQYSNQHFCQRLQSISAVKLGQLELASKRYQFKLIMSHAQRYVKEGVALVGDAAHSIHPLAGQGVNLGLRDVQALTDAIEQAITKKRRLAALDTLRRYERSRKGDVWSTIMIMEAFKRGFVNDSRSLAWLRSQGFRVTDSCQLLKRFFIRQAS